MVKEAKINIFELADANAENLKKEFQNLMDNCDKKKFKLLEGFRNKIRERWSISVNMEDWPLIYFLVFGEYVNIYLLKEKQVDQLVDRGMMEKFHKKGFREVALRKHLKKWYEPRKIFDSSIIDGEKVKYLALNCGGIGIKQPFGSYCVGIKKKEAENYNTLAFIKRDSAKYYVDASQKCVLVDKLAQDVSNKECVDILTALKHKDEIDTVPSGRFEVMVCSNKSYVEAVTVDDISGTQIGYVRMEKRLYDFYFKELKWKELMSELSEDEERRLKNFELLNFQLEKLGIKLEPINGN